LDSNKDQHKSERHDGSSSHCFFPEELKVEITNSPSIESGRTPRGDQNSISRFTRNLVPWFISFGGTFVLEHGTAKTDLTCDSVPLFWVLLDASADNSRQQNPKIEFDRLVTVNPAFPVFPQCR
jgi:hypothetical protein